MSARHYDVLVLGGGTAALVAAALLAKRGLRGLLVDQGELARREQGGLSQLLPSDQASPVMDHVHGELGIKDEIKVRASPVPPLQAIFPDQRVDLFSLESALSAELGRAFPHEVGELPAFFDRLRAAEAEVSEFLLDSNELPASGFFGRRLANLATRRHAAVMGKLTELGTVQALPAPLLELFCAPLPFVSHLDTRRPEEATLARFARPLARFLRGFFRLDDGRSPSQLLLELAERKGFERRRSALESLELESKSVACRLVGKSEERVSADLLIDATADLSGLDAMSTRGRSKEQRLLLESAKPRGHLHRYAVEVDQAVLPPGLAAYALLLNGRRDRSRFDASDPDAEDRPILLATRPVGPGRSLLLAEHPISSSRAHAQKREQLDVVIRARLERLIPFLPEGSPRVLSGPEVEPHHPFFDPELDPSTGITGVPMRTEHKQVFLAGPAVLPGLGVEGEYLAALQAVDACLAARGAKRGKRLAERLRA